MREFFKKNIWLLLIFFLALFLRLYQLHVLPKGFYEEEVTNAYVGRFIFQNGKDLYGNRWPILYFDKFGDFPPVLPMYISALGTYLFGLTAFGARFATALIGALTVFPLYGLAFLILKDKRISLFSTVILATAPWHVVLSRTGAEGVMGLSAYVWALYLILKGILDKEKKPLWWSFVLFFLTYHLYPSLRLLVPLTLLPMPFLVAKKDRDIKKIVIVGLIGSFLLTGLIAATPWGRGRFEQTSIFQNKEIRDRIQANMTAFNYSEKNILVARIFNNKIVGYTRELFRQYFSYISPDYLFLVAGGQPRYYNVPEQGLLFITTAALLFFTILPVTTNVSPPLILFVIYLLIISPIPAVLTIDFVPHAHRSMFMLVPLIILAAYGLMKAEKLSSKKIPLLAIVVVLLLVETVYFWHRYSVQSDANQSILRNVGDTEMAEWLVVHHGEYIKVIMPPFERIPIYYLYFSGDFSPTLIGHFRSQLELDHVDNIAYFSDWCPPKYVRVADVPKNTLVIENGDCDGVKGWRDIKTITRTDSTKAYRFLTPE